MDTRTGEIYATIDEAKAAGVPDRHLVSGTREALDDLRERLTIADRSKKLFRSFRDAPRAEVSE